MHTQTLEPPTITRTETRTHPARPAPPSAPPAPPAAPAPTPPEGPNLSRLLHALYDPDNHTPRLCDLFDIDLGVLSDALLGDQIDHAIGMIEKLSDLRTRLLRAEAVHTAMARLIDLAGNFPTTPREKETSRKAAAQLLRILAAHNKLNLPPSQTGGDGEAQPSQRGGRGGSAPNHTTAPDPTPTLHTPDRKGGDGSNTQSSPVAERGGRGRSRSEAEGEGEFGVEREPRSPSHPNPK